MSAKPKKRLCWNCEGNVSFKEDTCPYCGVSLIPTSIPGLANKNDTVITPPYKFSNKEREVPPSPFSVPKESSQPVEEKDEDSEDGENAEESTLALNEMKATSSVIALLLSGSVFALFGAALYLFSHKGTFTLSWNAEHWYIYLLLGTVMMGFGWHYLNQLKEPEELEE
jgi:hypothetical protein